MKSIHIYLLLVSFSFSVQLNAQKILTKKEAISMALKNNYGILLAKNAVEVAKNNSSIYNSKMLPTVSASAGTNYNNSNQDIERQDGSLSTIEGAETKSHNASVNLNYTLFDGLGRKYTYQQLKETHHLTELEARETIESTYVRLFTIYFQIARLSENTETLKEALAISKQRLLRATYRYEYGRTTRLDVLNAKVDVNNDSINFINSQQLFKNAKRDLNIVLVKQKNINYTVETSVEFIPLFSFDDLYKKALKSNTGLKQQGQNIAINKYALKAIKGGYLPSVGLSSSYGWNKSINPASSFLANSAVTGVNFGLNLSWNIFDGGNTKTRVANSKIALENQQIIQQQQINNLKSVLQNTWDEYHNKLFVLKAQEQNVLTAQNNFERTNEKHKLGQVSSIEYRQAQINLLNTKTSVNNAKFDAKIIEIQLLQLSGQLLDIKF
ncbi:MAG: TolC family protein [Polaribacter sp.]|nr:TolC family protein [Polaribacter sp.]